MGVEIERKYLVTGEGYRNGADVALIRQGYLNRDHERVVRVRVHGERGFLTIKGAADGPRRAEYEYEIPPGDALELLELCLPVVVEKTRHRVTWGGRLWEVDVFTGANEGLLVAECELEHEDETIVPPPWLGAEVTGNRRYANSELARRPYTTW